MEKNVNTFLGVSIDKIKEMVDVNTVIGDPITVDGGVTIVPVSRMSYGFAAGGSDFPNKSDRDIFGGGTGAGVSVTPLALLVIRDGDVKMLPINAKPGTLDGALGMVPGMVDKIAGFFKKDNKPTDADTTAPEGEIIL